LKSDLRFLLTKMKRPIVGWHDPNFGIRFDDYLDAIEEAVPPGRIRFIAESTLSLLSEPHVVRMKRNGFKALLPGVESWYDLGNKSKTGKSRGMDKVRKVSEQINMILRYLPYVHADFILGLDVDEGPEQEIGDEGRGRPRQRQLEGEARRLHGHHPDLDAEVDDRRLDEPFRLRGLAEEPGQRLGEVADGEPRGEREDVGRATPRDRPQVIPYFSHLLTGAARWASWPTIHTAQVMAKSTVQPARNLRTSSFMAAAPTPVSTVKTA
jgi:hypothetical protein